VYDINGFHIPFIGYTQTNSCLFSNSVLSRLLMKMIIGAEYKGKGYSQIAIDRAKNDMRPAIDHIDKVTGERIAFNTRGNNRGANFRRPRTHDSDTNCPSNFTLVSSTIYLQEAPDMYCNESFLAKSMMMGGSTKVKVVHFVRNPFDMALSNYYYHSQENTPEDWVNIDKPCQFQYEDGTSLADYVLPTLSQRTNITQSHFDNAVSLCESLYDQHNSTFYEHLRLLSPWDGMRLATSQMIISSSASNNHLAGGDILRMTNNIIQFERLQASQSIPEDVQLMAINMDDYMLNIRRTTMDLLDYVFGADESVVSSKLRTTIAISQEKEKNPHHSTQGKYDNREKLKEMLKHDPILGLILSETERLVNGVQSRK